MCPVFVSLVPVQCLSLVPVQCLYPLYLYSVYPLYLYSVSIPCTCTVCVSGVCVYVHTTNVCMCTICTRVIDTPHTGHPPSNPVPCRHRRRRTREGRPPGGALRSLQRRRPLPHPSCQQRTSRRGLCWRR